MRISVAEALAVTLVALILLVSFWPRPVVWPSAPSRPSANVSVDLTPNIPIWTLAYRAIPPEPEESFERGVPVFDSGVMFSPR